MNPLLPELLDYQGFYDRKKIKVRNHLHQRLRTFVVRVTGFEPAASCSQSRRATNCATPGYSVFHPAGHLLPMWRATNCAVPRWEGIPAEISSEKYYTAKRRAVSRLMRRSLRRAGRGPRRQPHRPHSGRRQRGRRCPAARRPRGAAAEAADQRC